MRRSITSTTLSLLLLTSGFTIANWDHPPASSAHPAGPCAAPWQVSIKPSLGRTVVHDRVLKLIGCAVKRWPVDGGLHRAVCTAERESGPYTWPWADSGSSKGVFQLNGRYYDSWAHRYLEARWFPVTWVPGYFNARANVLTAVHMAHAGGWGPWSGGCG